MDKATNIPLNTNHAIEIPNNGESLGTCLLLQFSPGANFPSKEDLLTTFYQFGPLKVSETQLLKDGGSAQVVFVRSADAVEAFHSLEQNKFAFCSTIVDYKLCNYPLVENHVTPSQPTRSMDMMPGATPLSLQFIKQRLEMMLSILENSGNSLTPPMRGKLDYEIKNLLSKVNSRLGLN